MWRLHQRGVTAKFLSLSLKFFVKRGGAPYEKSQPQEYSNQYLIVAILAEMVGFAVCCGLWPCILSGLAWCARLFCLKTVYHTVFLTAKPFRVQIPPHNITKKQPPGWVAVFWRRWWDSNPRAGSTPTKRFRVALVTTTSIHLHM